MYTSGGSSFDNEKQNVDFSNQYVIESVKFMKELLALNPVSYTHLFVTIEDKIKELVEANGDELISTDPANEMCIRDRKRTTARAQKHVPHSASGKNSTPQSKA